MITNYIIVGIIILTVYLIVYHKTVFDLFVEHHKWKKYDTFIDPVKDSYQKYYNDLSREEQIFIRGRELGTYQTLLFVAKYGIYNSEEDAYYRYLNILIDANTDEDVLTHLKKEISRLDKESIKAHKHIEIVREHDEKLKKLYKISN